ncbi:MAG: T9SS type A sorting domain-containing protein [Saprospiraceae bacterium]
MKKSLVFLLITIIYLACKNKSESDLFCNFPAPTETFVSKYMLENEGKHRGSRQAWFDLMHGGEASNWKAIEDENSSNTSVLIQKKKRHFNRGEIEYFAENALSGKWIERGSVNQAGNIRITEYDAPSNTVYCLGGGGPLYKMSFDDNVWHLVNDDYRFNGNFLELITLEDDSKRLISAIGGTPYYSDDYGVNWTRSSGLVVSGNYLPSGLEVDNQLLILYKKDYWSNLGVYFSENGTTYKKKLGFSSYDSNTVRLRKANNEVYAAEKIGTKQINIWKWNGDSLEFEKIVDKVTVPEAQEINIRGFEVTNQEDQVKMFLLDDNNYIYTSIDLGLTWNKNMPIPSNPWDVGLFAFPSNPDKMLYGEVDAYKSANGGLGWDNVNRWWEYYGDPATKLHADIMSIKEFTTRDGINFCLISNHGGINYTEDYGENNFNISLFGLNVGQFYDVKTDPNDPFYVYGGTQDQGLQRGIINGDDSPSELVQNISGDYGHLVFTHNGEHLWTVYPGGWIGVYESPRIESGPTASYEINSSNETVWIPPIIPSSNANEDVIYAAGGSIDPEDNGSYIIRIENSDGFIAYSQLPFDFSEGGGTISALAISPFNDQLWFVLTTNGQCYRSTDGGMDFQLVQEFISESHYLYGSCVLPSNVDPNIVYISGNGYNFSPVYVSYDGGQSFTPMSNGMPKTMCFNLAMNKDETLIFAATESGPYVYVVDKEEWFPLTGAETPNQTFWSVEYVDEIETARFGTYGRGIWDFNVEELVSTFDKIIFDFAIDLFPNPASEFLNISIEKFENLENGKCTVIDASGKVMNELKLLDSKTSLDVSDYPAGQYFLNIEKEGQTLSKPFIKI